MTLSDLLGSIGGAFAFAAVIGNIHQILTLRRRKSSGDISLLSVHISLGGWLSWALYGMTVGKIYLFVPQTINVVLTAILIGHVYAYRPR